jgi:CHAT domain-containing protein
MYRLGLLLPVLCLLASCSKPPDAAAVHASAVRAIQDGELKQAQELLDKAFGSGKLLKPSSNPDPLIVAGISQSDADRLRLLQSEILLEQGKAPAALELLDQLPDPQEPESHLRWLVNRAVALSKTDKLERATAALDQLDRESGALGSSEPVLKAQLLRGNLLVRARMFDQADALFQKTASIAEHSDLPFYRSAALLNLSLSSLRRRRFDESVEYSRKALESGNRRLEASINNNLGIAYYRLGDLEKAEHHEVQAIDQASKAGDARTQADALGGLANVKMGLGDTPEAVKALEQAVEISKRIGANSDAYRWAGNLATAHIIAKQWDEAEKWNREAYGIRNLLELPDKPLMLQFNAAEIAVGRGQNREAEELYREVISGKPEGFLRWDAHARLANLLGQQKRFAEAKHEDAQALSAMEDERSNLTQPEARITFAFHLASFFERSVDQLVRDGQFNEALELVEYSRARVMAEKLGLQPQSIRQVRTAKFQAYARRSGDVMLSYWLGPERSYVWVVNADGIHMKELPPRASIAADIAVYRRMIEENLRDPISDNLSQGESLSNVLLGPVHPYLKGARRVIVVPDGELHMLNLETLPVASSEGNRYWIEIAEVAIAPSLDLLSGASTSTAVPVQSVALLFGAPTSARVEYPVLPGAKSEIDGIGGLFGGTDKNRTLIAGAEATPSRFLNAMPSQYSMIHFATHAETNPDSPLDSAIILSDDGRGFKLYARDIAQLKLTANLVTLSACRSAGARSYNGEGMVGFAWAFMQSGVRNVIAGLWDVDDTYSSQIMISLYRGIASGLRPSTALRAAKLELLKGSGARRKPVYWAPYQTYLR